MKYELGQVIYYILDNRVHSAPVGSRMTVENSHDDWAHTSAQKESWTPFGESRIVYATCHNNSLTEEECFASKEELLASL